MSEEMMIIVDPADDELGIAPRSEVRKYHLRHRGVAIVVLNHEGDIFVHKRSDEKDLWPGMYDVTIGGGVVQGEDYEAAAERELAEETGITDRKLVELFTHTYEGDENKWVAKVFRCVYGGEITFPDKEIVWGEFKSMEEIEEMMKEKKFVPDGLEIYDRIKNETLTDI